MKFNLSSCIKCVGEQNSLKINKVVKAGFTKAGKQRFRCKACGKTSIANYTYRAYQPNLNHNIVQLTKEGMGIRSSARFLKISTTTLLKRILSIADKLKLPVISIGKSYEVDELCTFVKRKSKPIWIVCAYERESKRVVSFCTGNRTNQTLSIVLKTLRFAKASYIFTDGLKNYRYLIDKAVHQVVRYGTNRIERFNLTLRTHLKRLNRRTICFSRSITVLNAMLKIYLLS